MIAIALLAKILDVSCNHKKYVHTRLFVFHRYYILSFYYCHPKNLSLI